MKTVVLIKQVPATDTKVEIADDGVTIKEDAINWVINPYDEYAVEEALRIRESHEGTVTALSIGPDRVRNTLLAALAMGADQAIHINDPQQKTLSGLGIARILSKALKEIPYDLIIAGAHSIENKGRQVGIMVAELLNISCIPMVIHQEIKGGEIICERALEEGVATLRTALPILFTAQKGLNEPRCVALSGIMKARKKPIVAKKICGENTDWSAGNSGMRIVSLRTSATKRLCRIVNGDSPVEKATQLVDLLRKAGKLRGAP